MEVACCIGMEDSQVYHHLLPIALHPGVSRVWIVRSHEAAYGAIPGAAYRLVPAGFKPWRWWRMWRECLALARRAEVKAFVSFNPFPYGLIGSWAARRYGKQYHFGFVGTDWYTHMYGPLRRYLLGQARGAHFITATGEGMRAEMGAAGLDTSRVRALPHSVDLDHYPVADPAQADYTFIYVGKLVERKRVDVILKALARVLETVPGQRLCVVGEGPRRASLEDLAQTLGVAEHVDFVGFRRNVVDYYRRAKVDLIASTEEGFPFSLVEGICCGLVPVSTPVGTVTDFVRDGDNGIIVPVDDVAAMAEAMTRLAGDVAELGRMRQNVLGMRNDFSYAAATKVWDGWLQSLA